MPPSVPAGRLPHAADTTTISLLELGGLSELSALHPALSTLAWFALPVVATLLAMLWTAYAGRRRPPSNEIDSMERHARLRAALAADTTPRERTRR